MINRVKYALVLFWVLILSVILPAESLWTDGDSLDSLWDNPANWDSSVGNAPPNPDGPDSTYIRNLGAGKRGPVIDHYIDPGTGVNYSHKFVRRFRFELPDNQETKLTIIGNGTPDSASLNVGGWYGGTGGYELYGYDTEEVMDLALDGGELWMPAGPGVDNLAHIEILDGGLLTAWSIRIGSGGGGQIDLFDGRIVTDSLSLADGGLLDIRNESTLEILDTTFDKHLSLAQAIENDYVVAENGRGLLDIEVGDDIYVQSLPLDVNIAWNPSPAHTHPLVVPDANGEITLSWNAGDNAAQTGDGHLVYFGSNPESLSLVSTQQAGNTTFNTSELTQSLYLDNTYYWRVDEVNGVNEVTGQLWQFTVSDYAIIDQFETYTDQTELTGAWTASGGGSIALETEDPTRMAQSMKLIYDGESSASLVMDANNKDWTRFGAEAFCLWFYGDQTNDIEPIYITLEDGTTSSTVIYDELTSPEGAQYDVNDIAIEDWHTCFIDLQEFADDGIDLANIQKLTIDVGKSGSTGIGQLWLDNIRLYAPMCVDAPAMDLNGNCVVDMEDFAVMASEWLDNGIWP